MDDVPHHDEEERGEVRMETLRAAGRMIAIAIADRIAEAPGVEGAGIASSAVQIAMAHALDHLRIRGFDFHHPVYETVRSAFLAVDLPVRAEARRPKRPDGRSMVARHRKKKTAAAEEPIS